MPFRQTGFFKYRDLAFLPFLIIMFLYRAPNIWSIISGALIVFLGQALRIWAAGFGSTANPGDRIYIGPFSHTRYPFLTGNILIYTGLTLMSCALFPYLQLIVLIYFVLVYRSLAVALDSAVTGSAAPEFQDYCRKVPALRIRLSSYKMSNTLMFTFSLSRARQNEMRSIQAILFFSLTLFLIWFVGRY